MMISETAETEGRTEEVLQDYDVFDSPEEKSGLRVSFSFQETPTIMQEPSIISEGEDSIQALDRKIAALERKKLTRVDSISQKTELQESEDEIWLRKVQICVTRLGLLDPERKKLKTSMHKYFHIWSLCLPLNQKCEELGKQLQERNGILQTVRESYLRDVVR